MKKNRILTLVIFLLGLCLFKIDKVFADSFTIHYEDCNSLSGQTQTVTIGTKTATYKCTDSDFVGWKVEVSGKGWYCDGDKGATPHLNCGNGDTKLYNNGAVVSQTGNDGDNVYFHAVKTSTNEKFTVVFQNGAPDATGSMANQEIYVGKKTKLLKNQFKRENYRFIGWHVKVVDADGSVHYYCSDGAYRNSCVDAGGKNWGYKLYHDEATVSITGRAGSTVYMTAQWEPYVENEAQCIAHTNEVDCTSSGKCSWNSEYSFCSVDGLSFLSCGDANGIPSLVPKLSSHAVTLLKIAAPIVLIAIAIVQLIKAMGAGKEEEIKKAQTGLFKKAIYAALVFFVVTIVQFIMLKVADSSEKDNLSSCLSCFLNGTDDCGNIYYKDGYGKCYYINNRGTAVDCESVK